ncbi:MAG: hypothetical protein RBQ94_00010 [Methanimicrococcus sp.]|nr:hypothetical protein [Methanimicrococcus sp.]
MQNVTVTFFAPVYITESPEKVGAAVSHLVNYGRPKSEEIRPEMISCADKEAAGNMPERDGMNPPISDAENIKEVAVISGDLNLLTGIHYLIRKEEIIDTANTALKEGTDAGGCQICVALNKQAALMKRLSFPADSETLGSVYLKIETENEEDLLKIIDWLTPPTKDGIPLYELKKNEL